MLKDLLRRYPYFAPDDGAGGGTADADAADADSADDAAATDGADDAAGADDQSGDAGDAASDDGDKADDSADDPLAKLTARLDALEGENTELRTKVTELSTPKSAEKPVEGDKQAETTDVPDFREKAYAEAIAADKLDAEGDITAEGIRWAENRAIQLAVEHQSDEQRNQQIQTQKPQFVTAYTEEFKKLGIPDEAAPQVSQDYTDIVTGYGKAAFGDDRNAVHLRTTAYYVALGMQAERDMKAAQEAGQEAAGAHDKAKEPVGDGGTGGEGVYTGFTKEDASWAKITWAKRVNGGKPPTKAQIAALKTELYGGSVRA